jgi:hypothetical protein
MVMIEASEAPLLLPIKLLTLMNPRIPSCHQLTESKLSLFLRSHPHIPEWLRTTLAWIDN